MKTMFEKILDEYTMPSESYFDYEIYNELIVEFAKKFPAFVSLGYITEPDSLDFFIANKLDDIMDVLKTNTTFGTTENMDDYYMYAFNRIFDLMSFFARSKMIMKRFENYDDLIENYLKKEVE